MKTLLDFLKRKRATIAALGFAAVVIYPPATEGVRAVQAAVDAVVSATASTSAPEGD